MGVYTFGLAPRLESARHRLRRRSQHRPHAEKMPARTSLRCGYLSGKRGFRPAKNKAFLDERCFILQGTASDLPFEGDTFDVATAFETLYFWEDPDKAFCEILRILKPGGIFLIACEASNPHNTTWTDRIEGMSVYTAEEIKHKLENCGFVHVRTDKMKKESICVTAQKQKNRLNTQTYEYITKTPTLYGKTESFATAFHVYLGSKRSDGYVSLMSLSG